MSPSHHDPAEYDPHRSLRENFDRTYPGGWQQFLADVRMRPIPREELSPGLSPTPVDNPAQ